MRERHTAFQALLQTNMTVLATAHAVSEGIIRGVSGELARKRAPVDLWCLRPRQPAWS